jgi:multicomponent K+:H+ antiporter subunit D
MPHWLIAPVLLPLVAVGLMLLGGERGRVWRASINIVSCTLNLVVAIVLLRWVHRGDVPGAIGVYLPGNWDMPFGLVLAMDRLSALLVLLTAVIALAALLFSLARWHRAGVHFHPLFQIQLMGLNGAFLTADLFNLFVFFEILLAASYGLLLHGGGRERVRTGLHYIAFNLGASLLFLIGVAVLYGVTGTLNMADMARKLPLVPEADRALLQAGAAILALAFLGKAALWPLNFWLAPAYSAAGAPVAAYFALMTKVGVYAVLRLWTLLFPAADGGAAGFGFGEGATFGTQALVWGGLATLVFGTLGMFGTQRLGRLAAFSLVVSSGTLLASFGFGRAALSGAALFYMLSSTLGVAAMFLLVELLERARQSPTEGPLYEDAMPDGRPMPFVIGHEPAPGINLDDDQIALIGRPVPAALAFLGICFIASALVMAGLPPLAGFVSKVALISAMLMPVAPGTMPAVPLEAWVLTGLLIVSGLLATVALSRAGIHSFWTSHDRAAPHLRAIEFLPVAGLLLAVALITLRADSVMRYTQAAVTSLYQPSQCVETVLATQPRPGPTRLTPPAPAASAARKEGS